MTDSRVPVVCARALAKTFGAHVAVHSLDLAIGAGEIVALLGGNGAGKTTTLHMLMGFVPPTSGTALIDGVDIRLEPVRAREAMAYLPEIVALYPHLSGLQNLRYFTSLGTTAPAETELRAWLGEVGLASSAADRKLATYSKGMRQKVGLALALHRRAKALVLDEPLSGLDPTAANELTVLLRRIASQGTAILMATHDIFRARALADRVCIMRDGRMVADVASTEITLDALEERYLAEMSA